MNLVEVPDLVACRKVSHAFAYATAVAADAQNNAKPTNSDVTTELDGTNAQNTD
jgi:hypothetical protein